MLKIKDLLRKIQLRGRLILFMTVIIVLISCFNLYFYNKAYSSMDEYNQLLKDYTEVNNLSIKLLEGRDSISKFFSADSGTAGDIKDLVRYNDSIIQTNMLADQISSTSNSLDTYLLSNSIKNSLSTYNEEMQKILLMKPGSEATYLQFSKSKNDSIYIEGYIKQLLNIKLTEGEWYYQHLTSRVKAIRLFNFISIFVIMIISLIYVVALSNGITIPIKKLTQYSRKISHGDFESKELALNSSEDINILSATLNKMSRNIHNMINIERQLHEEEIKSIRISKELNEARFLALQSQINPHFLFNTLNTIARFSMFEGAIKTTGLIESLSSIFRYSLKSQDELLLSDELKIINEYVKIQAARFGDRFKFDIIRTTDIENVHVPRFIIQPLVENAVIHGLEPKESNCGVRIKIFQKKDFLIIKVIDSGVGIPKERLQKLLNNTGSNVSNGHSTGIGLSNVRERIELYYKGKAYFDIKSKKNIGTIITLKIVNKKGD